MALHMFLTLQTIGIISIQLYKSSNSHLPAFSKVIISYLILNVLSNASLASMDHGAVITVYILGVSFLIVLPIIRVVGMKPQQCATYFKLRALKEKLQKFSEPKHIQESVLRASAICAILGVALIILSAFWPWFAISFEPTDKLQILNETLTEIEEKLETIGAELQAVLEAVSANLSGLGSCEALVAAGLLAPVLGPAARPLLNAIRTFMLLRRLRDSVGKYREHVMILRQSTKMLHGLIKDTNKPLTFGMSVANIGMVS